MMDQAFEALKTFDWGDDLVALQPIADSVITTRQDPAARQEIETKLAAVLTTDAPRAAKDYACRQLRAIGTAGSVPALAALLPDPELSHMARYALERIPDASAGEALRKALSKTEASLKIGILSSLGVRAEEASVQPLGELLGDSNEGIANAAAHALGTIGTPTAVQAMAGAPMTSAVEDALLRSAEKLKAGGNEKDSRATYQMILKRKPSAGARRAAEEGLS